MPNTYKEQPLIEFSEFIKLLKANISLDKVADMEWVLEEWSYFTHLPPRFQRLLIERLS